MRLRFLAFVPVLASISWLACSSSSAPPSSPAVIPEAALGGACGAAVVASPPKSANHVPEGTVVPYSTNPPCGGDHYPIWATWGVHTKPLPAGYWVHNQEHGGVVMLYRCADRAACPALAAQVEAVAASLPHDPTCDPSILTRVVVLPDPDLPAGVQIAAAAWGYSWTATCFDGARLKSFAEAAMRHGPEDECAQGFVGDEAPTTEGGADAADDAPAPSDADADGSEVGDAATG
jgi:hypothetical protein